MPTVTLDYTNTAIQDTFVAQVSPTTNFGTGASFKADTAGDEMYIKFNLGLIPNDVIVSSAVLNLVSWNNYGDVDVSVYDILSPWEEAAVTWNTKPSTKFETTLSCKSLVDGTQVNIPVTSLVQRMVQTGETKYGFCLKGNKSVGFYSKETPKSGYQPKLVITYSIPETRKKQVEKVGFSTLIEITGNVRERTINLPAGTQQGDFMVLSVTSNVAEPPAIPAGWMALDAGSGQLLHTYYKFAGDNEDGVLMSYSTTRNFCASIYTYRNVKNIHKLGKNSGADALALLPGPVSVPSVDSLVAITVSIGGNYSTGGKPNVAKEFSIHGGRGLSKFTTYNHEKTSYSNRELEVSINTSTAYEVLGYSLEPIINTAPIIDGQDGYLGSFPSPFTKEYLVTDYENDALTIVEKIDGVEINTKNTHGLNTVDLTAQWNELSYGEHTVTIEVNDAYDPTRKAVRTWTFLKILASNADLIKVVKGVQDLQSHIQKHKDNLASNIIAKGLVLTGEELLTELVTKVSSITYTDIKAGDVVVYLDSPSKQTSAKSFTTMHQATIKQSGTYRVSFEFRSNGYGVNAMVFVNDIAVGINRSTNSTSFQKYTQDFTLKRGDILQIKAYAPGESGAAETRNFALQVDMSWLVSP